MKLFQKLLLVPTAIGLATPIAASASETNYGDVTDYSLNQVEVSLESFKPLSSKNPLLAGGEGLGQNLSNDFDTDTFSSTTSASFTSNWVIGAVDGVAAQEKVGATYDWSVDLITSFDGNDSLDVTLEAGEGGATLTEMDLTETGDRVNVGSISYTRTVGDYLTFYVSPAGGGDGSSLFTKACAYEGQTNVLDDCSNFLTNMDQNLGTAFSAAVELDNGLGVAFGYEGQDNHVGLGTNEGLDLYSVNLSYVKDSYGVSYVFSEQETVEVQALNAFYTPDLDRFPSFSFGIEWAHYPNNAENADETSHYFFGAQFNNVGNGTLGAAVGSKEPYFENLDAETMWEAYYAYNYADGITITPVVYVKENAATNTDDETGIILKTTFEF